MIEDDWEPEQKDIEWTKQHVEQMSIGDTWGVADAVMRKVSDSMLMVVNASPNSIMSLQRIDKVLQKFDVVLDASQAELIQDPQAAAQESAQEWTCPTSGIPLVNFDLDEPEWILLDDKQESWRVIIKTTDDESVEYQVEVSPMDYHLLAGDELFFSWKGDSVMERHEIIEVVDEGVLLTKMSEGSVYVMPSEYMGEVIPPHLRGLIFHDNSMNSEEE
jgi:hypothetical protein